MISTLRISSIFLLTFILSSRWKCSSRKFDLGNQDEKSNHYLPRNASTFSFGFDPSKSIQLSWHPRIFLYEGFISDEECDHLLSQANGNLHKPLATGNNTGGGSSTADAVSSHTTYVLARGLDEVVSRIEERISAWTFLPNENGENMQIFHYRVNDGGGGSEQPHRNSFEEATTEPHIATIFIFLSNASHGGEIIFPKSKIMKASNTRIGGEMWSECASSSFAVKHVRLNALLIFNLHLNGTVDESSSNSACSVLEGEKWSARKRIHARAFHQKKHSPESYEDCADEDDNCRKWAAVGECRRNAVYMLGTPDYYGACRKSCGVC